MSFQDVCREEETNPLQEGDNNCIEVARPVGNINSHLENIDPHSFVGNKTLTVSSNLEKILFSKLRGKYPCSWCSKLFHYKSTRDFHARRCHSNAFSMTSPSKGNLREPALNIVQKKRSVLFSKRRKIYPKIVLQRKNKQTLPNFRSFLSPSFQDDSPVNRHPNMRKNTKMPLQAHFFHCSLCEYKTDHKLTFDRHILKHTISRLVCDQCRMPFLRKENLLTHLQLKHSYTGMMPPSHPVWHRCPFCRYKTSFQSVMNKHIFKHNLASHTCDICHMPFINKANIFYHMKLKHPCENKRTTDKTERVLHKCPFCPFSSPAYSQISRHMTIRHYQEERYECKVCELFLPSQTALTEHNTQTHLHTNNFDLSLNSSVESTAECLYCPFCQDRLDVRSLLTHTGDQVCPTCNMTFFLDLLMEKTLVPNFTPEESFRNFPTSTKTHHLSEVQQIEEIYGESVDLQNDNDARFKDVGNPATDVNQAIQKSHIDFIEINDDDDDDDVMRIDVDTTEKLRYPLRCTSSDDRDAERNVCPEETHIHDGRNNHSDLLTISLDKTFSNPGPSTSVNHSNSPVSKKGRYVKLVSDFDDFEERPFACALCYQRYSQFSELSVHVQNHLTGVGRRYGGDQSMDSFTW